MSEIKLKDFILDEIPEPEVKKYADKPPVEYEFILEYENDTDFILRRKTAKTDRSLVVIVSQAQIYIKDNKNNTVEKVVSKEQIQKFKSGLVDLPEFDKLIWQPFDRDYTGYSYNRKYFTKITDDFDGFLKNKDAYKVIANKKLNPFKNSNLVKEYLKDPDTFNKKLEAIKTMQLINPEFTMNEYWAVDKLKNFMRCDFHQNTITKMMDTLKELSTQFLNFFTQDAFSVAITRYSCDFKTLVNYLLYTIKYRNGLSIETTYNGCDRSFSLRDYVDYLSMQQDMYGKVKEKYPAYWLSEKQMMINKYNNWQKLNESLGVTLHQDSYKDLKYTDGFMSVIVPTMSSEILDEAEQQHHCVASYVDRVRKGETHIMFIRYKDSPEESLLTVEVTPEQKIVQVRGFMNRAYTHAEYDFMKEWATKKQLKLCVAEPKENENNE